MQFLQHNFYFLSLIGLYNVRNYPDYLECKKYGCVLSKPSLGIVIEKF